MGGTQVITIHHSPNSRRAREQAFLEKLTERFPDATIEKGYLLDPRYLECLVCRDTLIQQLRSDKLLPENRKKEFIERLKQEDVPPKLKVATQPTRISIDFVVCEDGRPYYWEFQEKQHRNLSNRATRCVYGPDNKEIAIERGLQRLIRDVWKVQCLRPYTIIWFDWFEKHKTSYKPELMSGTHEYCEDDKFSFQKFCRVEGQTGSS
jgi:hypothetical protein